MRCTDILLLSGLLLLYTSVFSQPGSFQFEYLHQGAGVEECYVNSIYKDKVGVLWVAGNRGIQYYDGLHIKSFEWSGKNSPATTSLIRVSSFAEDMKGQLWAGTDTGLVILSADRSRPVHPAQLGIPDSVSRADNCIVQPDGEGNIFLKAGLTIYRINAGSNKISEVFRIQDFKNGPGKVIRLLYVPREQAFYLIGVAFEIFRFRNGQLTNVNYPLYKKGSTQPEIPLNMTFELMWLMQDSLYLVSHNSKSKASYPVFLDDAKKAAFYSPADSIQSQIPVVKAWYSYCRKPESPLTPGMRSDLYIMQMLQGADNDWYIATSVGLFIAKETAYSFHPLRWTQGHSTRAITKTADGLLAVGSYNHLLYGYLSDTLCNRFACAPPWYFFQKGERSWDISTETSNSLFHLDLSKPEKPRIRPFFSEKALMYYHAAAAAGKGYWLACLPFSLVYFLPETGAVNAYTAPSSLNNSFAKNTNKTLLIQNQTLWAAGDAGLQAYRLNKEGDRIVEELTTSLPDTLRRISLNCLYADCHGKLWIGSVLNGLLSYDPEKQALQQWTPEVGLAHSNVYSIIGSHSDSVLWIGTQHGLSRLEVWNNTFCNYHTSDGLLHDEFNTASVYKAPDGTIFMGGPNGVSYFRSEDVPIKPSVSPGFIIMEIQNTSRHTRRILLPVPGSVLTLHPEDDYVALAFRSADFFHNREQSFRYRLIGLQQEWRYVEIEQQEVFTTLRPGEYLLEVQTQTNTGIWTTIYTLHLDVLPAWHQTWWFKVLVVLALALVFHTLYTFRLRQLRKEYELRKQVSDDLHDDLGSRIFALKSLASKVALPDQPETTRRQASEQFEMLSKEVLGRVRDFIWVFNPENDQLIHFLDRLDDYIRMTIMPLVASINFSYDVDEHVKFASKSRHHLMMILQELLVNMSKHTREPVIEVTAQVKDSILYFHIFNQHAGIQSADGNDRQSYGLSSIEKRLTQYDIRLSWQEDELSQTAKLSVKIAPHA